MQTTYPSCKHVATISLDFLRCEVVKEAEERSDGATKLVLGIRGARGTLHRHEAQTAITHYRRTLREFQDPYYVHLDCENAKKVLRGSGWEIEIVHLQYRCKSS